MQFIRCCTSNVIMEINVELFLIFFFITENSWEWKCSKLRSKETIGNRISSNFITYVTPNTPDWEMKNKPCILCPTIFKMSHDSSLALSSPREPEYKEKPQKSLNEKHQVDILFRSFIFCFFSFSKAVVWWSFKNYEFLPEAYSTCTQYSYYCLYSPDIFFMVILFSSVGKQRLANQVYFTRSKILWGQAYCCLPSLQIPSPMEVIWGWTNQCIWSYHSDNRCSNRGITDLCFTWFLYPGCLKIVTTVNPLVGPSKLNSFGLMAPRYFTGRMSEN